MAKALCKSGGLLKNIIDNLDGKNGDEWAEIFRRTLRRQNPFAQPVLEFKPSFKVDFLNRSTTEALEEIQKKTAIYPAAQAFFEREPRFEFGAGHIVENIMIVTLAQLGFSDRTKVRNVYVRAEEVGLEPCYGPTAAWTYFYQGGGFSKEHLHFGMEPEHGQILYHSPEFNRNVLDMLPVPMKSDCWPDERWAFAISQ